LQSLADRQGLQRKSHSEQKKKQNPPGIVKNSHIPNKQNKIRQGLLRKITFRKKQNKIRQGTDFVLFARNVIFFCNP
jgi:hypothetical protein